MGDEVGNVGEEIFRVFYAAFIPYAVEIFKMVFSCNFYLVKFVANMTFFILNLSDVISR